MKIFVCTSRHLYDKAKPVIQALEQAGHTITLPNNFDDFGRENRMKAEQASDYPAWKASMFRKQAEKVANNDVILVMNFEKEGKPNYIGGATFLEIFKAWELSKKIFFYNPIPEGMLRDELVGMSPTVINQDISLID
ncbi:hypothetical protein KW782_00780 [Candidatus Parcubacteria bacterium]|nr:hypothetical protein [Candidatus Parcubacteria bacterium]